MPASWHMEALKAQAIAARTYAYRYKIEGKQICVSESCQVFRKAKQITHLMPGNKQYNKQRSSFRRCCNILFIYCWWIFNYFWLGYNWWKWWGKFYRQSIRKTWGSPWLYKAWYRQGYTSSGNTCGQNDPWLNNEEFTDIINAAIVLKSGQDSRVSSISTSCWGGNPYSYAELKQKAGFLLYQVSLSPKAMETQPQWI